MKVWDKAKGNFGILEISFGNYKIRSTNYWALKWNWNWGPKQGPWPATLALAQAQFFLVGHVLGHVTKHFNYLYVQWKPKDKHNKEKKNRREEQEELSGCPRIFSHQKSCSKNSRLVKFLLIQGTFASWYSWIGVGSTRISKVIIYSSEGDLRKR